MAWEEIVFLGLRTNYIACCRLQEQQRLPRGSAAECERVPADVSRDAPDGSATQRHLVVRLRRTRRPTRLPARTLQRQQRLHGNDDATATGSRRSLCNGHRRSDVPVLPDSWEVLSRMSTLQNAQKVI